MEKGVSRPSHWNDDRPRQAFELALLGATEKEIAKVMGVAEHTIEYWKQNKPEFLEAMNAGKMEADAKVAHSLYRIATGYMTKEVHVIAYKGEASTIEVDKYVGPNGWAAVKWLSIRQRARWADVQRTELMQTNINVNKFDFTGMTTDELKMMKRIGLKQVEQEIGGN